MSAIVQPTTVAALEASPAFFDLLREYEAETTIPGVPPPSGKLVSFRQLEEADALHVLAATSAGHLIGFLAILAPFLAPYGRTVAVCESFIVSKEHRATGAGLKLIRAAEDKAREIGSPGFLLTVPYGDQWSDVLPRVGYEETGRVFFKNVGRADDRSGIISGTISTRLQ